LTYQEAKDYLEQTPKKGIVLGLETIGSLLEELGNPQDNLKYVHLAGTNGKGSVLAYTASILREAGYRTGQYTSPAVISRREQIQINGEWITKEEFAGLVMEVKDAVTQLKKSNKALPTVYEVETAMAFLYFKNKICDIVILETGMGGRDDATNVVRNTLVAGFTSISLDHMSYLGETIEEIATVKAGIIKPGSVVVSGVQEPSVLAIIEATTLAVQTELSDKERKLSGIHHEEVKDVVPIYKYVSNNNIKIIEETYKMLKFTYKGSESFTTQMAGKQQAENAALTLEIINSLQDLGYKISDKHIKLGLSQTNFFGRFTVIGEKPIFIVDGAHNENGVMRLRDNLVNLFPRQKITFIMGIYNDKKVDEIVKTILPLAKSIYTVSLFNKERTITAKRLKKICEEHYKVYHTERYNEYLRNHNEDLRNHNEGQLKELYDKRECKSRCCNSETNLDELVITACTSIREAVELAIGNAEEEGVVIAFGSLSYLWNVTKERRNGESNGS
jgi:dihydrofolate synthase/folylpolyglutamate synthase